MKFIMEFDCDNAAFDDLPATEMSRILRDVADKLEAGTHGDGARVFDYNGNAVGHWEVKD